MNLELLTNASKLLLILLHLQNERQNVGTNVKNVCHLTSMLLAHMGLLLPKVISGPVHTKTKEKKCKIQNNNNSFTWYHYFIFIFFGDKKKFSMNFSKGFFFCGKKYTKVLIF